MGQQLGLIKAARPAPPPVNRHGGDKVETLPARQGRREQLGERSRQRPDAVVFQQPYELAQPTFVRAIRKRGIKSLHAAATQAAKAVLVQRPLVHKGGPARGARIFRRQRRRPLQAICADRNTSEMPQRSIANPAIIGENEREATGRELPQKLQRERERIYRQLRVEVATGEDSPPT